MATDQIMSKVVYTGGLRTEAIHLRSNQQIVTDAPIDNQGKGEAFSPTDSCATSLATCMLTTMAIWGEPKNVSFIGATAEVEKIMAANPRRIAAINVHLRLPGVDWSPDLRTKVEQITKTCPVALSLHPDIKQGVSFQYHQP